MKKVILLLLFPLATNAQNKERSEYPFRFQLHGTMATPLFAFSNKTGNANIFGQAKMGGGGGWLLAYKIKNEFFAGITFNMMSISLDEPASKELIYNRHHQDSFFTTVNNGIRSVFAAGVSVEVSYKKRYPLLEIEPFARVGFMSLDYNNEASLYKKKKNSNYAETRNLWYEKSSFAPAFDAGLRIFKRVHWKGGISASVRYTYAPFTITINENGRDYLDQNIARQTFKVKQPFHALQYELGIQFRFYKKPQN
jgi:hypothetical protein